MSTGVFRNSTKLVPSHLAMIKLKAALQLVIAFFVLLCSVPEAGAVLPQPDIWLIAADVAADPTANVRQEGATSYVKRWPDRANGNDFAQNDESFQPILKPDGFGTGQPSIYFEPTTSTPAGSKYLLLTGYAGPTTAATIFARILPENDKGSIMSQGFYHGGSERGWVLHRGTDNWQNLQPNSLNWAHHNAEINGNHQMWAQSPAEVSPANTDQVVAVRMEGRNVRLYVDGVLVYTEVLFAANILYSSSYYQTDTPEVWVGRCADPTNYVRDHFKGHIKEIRFFKSAVTDNEFAAINAALQTSCLSEQYLSGDSECMACDPACDATTENETTACTATTNRVCDCANEYYHDGTACVAAPTCSDNIQNQDETDVDCGGPNCESCPCTKFQFSPTHPERVECASPPFDHASCQETRSHSALHLAFDSDNGNIRGAVNGGLGKYMSSDDRYHAWTCLKNHPCLSAPQAGNAETGDFMCFVYDETNRIFYPWGKNSDLLLF